MELPRYWIRPALKLQTTRGFHRFVWDLHYAAPRTSNFAHPIAATYLDTAAQPLGPWVLPGTYTVRLTIEGTAQPLTQTVRVKMDPRVKTPAPAIQQQFTLSMQLYDAIGKVYAELEKLGPEAMGPRGFGGGSGQAQPTDRAGRLRQLHQQMLSLLDTLQDVDVAPTTQVIAAVQDVVKRASQ